jgi:hypothetical protein
VSSGSDSIISERVLEVLVALQVGAPITIWRSASIFTESEFVVVVHQRGHSPVNLLCAKSLGEVLIGSDVEVWVEVEYDGSLGSDALVHVTLLYRSMKPVRWA